MKQRIVDQTIVMVWEPGDYETVEVMAVFYRTDQAVQMGAAEGMADVNARDVSEVLGVDPQDSDDVDAIGQPKRYIPLAEVYRMAGRSTQPWAREFADWVARRLADVASPLWAAGFNASSDPAIQAAAKGLETAWQAFYDACAKQAKEPAVA